MGRRHGAPAGWGAPIALKFAAAITLVVLAAMTAATWTSVRVVASVQEEEVNDGGIRTVATLAAALEIEAAAPGVERALLERLLGRVSTDTAGQGVIDALVFDRAGALLATGRGQDRIYRTIDETPVDSTAARQAGVQVHEFVYEGKPIRSFRRALRQAADGPSGVPAQVEVLLSATRIAQSRERMRERMLGVSALICAAAALASFVLGALLSRPIRILARDLRQVGAGNLEHQSEVRRNDEIGDLARAFNHMTAGLRQAQAALLETRTAEHELELARRIQERLLPAAPPAIAGYDIAAFYQPAREVGGDYYDFLRLDQEHLALVVADVSGKGVPGSLVMAMTRSLLRLAARQSRSPARTLHVVNRALSQDLGAGMFVTLLYGVLHLPSRRLEFVRAGHTGPLHAGDAGVVALHPAGMALGLDPSGRLFETQLETRRLELRPGDTLLAYTDGVIEAKSPSGQDYSEARLVEAVGCRRRASAQSLIDAVLAELRAHRRDAEADDDVTILALHVADNA